MKIIHLSDFHLDNEKLTIDHKNIIEALINDLKNYSIDNNTLLIFSGDFLNIGGKNIKANNAFYTFKEVVLDTIYTNFPNLKIKTFFSPGNHDIDRSVIKSSHKMVKEQLIKDINKRDEIYEEYKNDNVGFEKYNDFVEDFYKHFSNKEISKLESSFVIDLEDNKVGISSLNSSFLCYDDNDYGNILLLKKQITKSLNYINDCDIKIAILHHPINFFHQTESEEIQSLLEREYDMVFLGHTHKLTQSYNQTLNGNCFFSNGKSLDGKEYKNKDYSNGYSILEYTPNLTIEISLRKYNHSSKRFIPNDDYGVDKKVFKVDINKNINNQFFNELKISDSFKEYLNDVGVNLTHKNKNKISLNDIFVYPNLEYYNISDSSDEEKNSINSKELLDSIEEKNAKIILLGDDSSGKTSLCKKAFEIFLNKEEFFPLLINGDEIKSNEVKKNEKLKNIILNEQYESEKIPPHRKPILLIDNFNETKLDNRQKKQFIKNIIEDDISFILVWDEFLTLNEICESLISEINVYKILPLGIEYRFKLIEKWVGLGEFKNEQEKIKTVYELEKLVDLIIGKNLVPSYPLYILTVLQTTELLPNENFEKSTLGHYYDVLIKIALSKNVDNKEIEKYYSYLSELSYFLFKNDEKILYENMFIDFHKNFINNYNINSSFKNTIEKLINSDIIIYNASNDSYKFRYDYIYYYFLGKYLADNVEEDNVKQMIIKIVETLYNTHSANTYLFLSHHTKSKFVIETIVKTAKELFKDEEIASFSDDIGQVNKLITETSQNIVLDISKSHRENKEEDLKEQENDTLLKDTEEFNSIDYISNINKVFKTIEILGLILKNRYASLKKDDKHSITREIYLLGLRTTSTIFRTLLEGEEFLKDDLIKIIGTEKSFSKIEQEQLAKKIIFNIYYMTAYTIIKRISNSIATKDLQLTFSDVKNEYKENNAIGLIDIANKFEYSTRFPLDDVDNLTSKFKNNKFPYFLLRRLSFNYLRMFPMEISEKQRVCQKLEISIDSQRRVQKSSKIKRRK